MGYFDFDFALFFFLFLLINVTPLFLHYNSVSSLLISISNLWLQFQPFGPLWLSPLSLPYPSGLPLLCSYSISFCKCKMSRCTF